MRVQRVLGLFVCLLAMVGIVLAANNMGIRDNYRITFVAPVHIGTAVLPAGDYKIHHVMEGQEHIMVFQRAVGKGPEVKAKCTLVPLAKKAEKDSTIYFLNAANERVLEELVFRGDTAKHVF